MSPVAVLVGTMGAGKTTVGRLVADALAVGFADSDQLIEAQAGKSVQEIFVDDGEAAFRALERENVAAALERDGVLSLGGGAVLDPATRQLLADHPVVFLRVGLAEAVKRVGLGAPGRPLLLGNVRARVKQLLDERTPIYEGVARWTVDTDGRSPQDVAAEVVERLQG